MDNECTFDETLSCPTCSYGKKGFTERVILGCGHSVCLTCAGKILSKTEEGGGRCCPQCGFVMRGNFIHHLQLGKVDATGNLMNEGAASYSSCPPGSTDIAWSEGDVMGDEDTGSERSDSSGCSIASISPPPNMSHDNPPVVSKEISDLEKSTPSTAPLSRAGFKPGSGSGPSSLVQYLQMAVTMNNELELEYIRNQFHEILHQEEENTGNFVKTLKTTPKEMKAKLELCVKSLLALCKNELEGDAKKKQEELDSLSGQLQKDLENYISEYEKKFKTSAIKAGCAVGAVGIGLAGAVMHTGMAAVSLFVGTVSLFIWTVSLFVLAVAGASGFDRSQGQTREHVLRKKK